MPLPFPVSFVALRQVGQVISFATCRSQQCSKRNGDLGFEFLRGMAHKMNDRILIIEVDDVPSQKVRNKLNTKGRPSKKTCADREQCHASIVNGTEAQNFSSFSLQAFDQFAYFNYTMNVHAIDTKGLTSGFDAVIAVCACMLEALHLHVRQVRDLTIIKLIIQKEKTPQYLHLQCDCHREQTDQLDGSQCTAKRTCFMSITFMFIIIIIIIIIVVVVIILFLFLLLFLVVIIVLIVLL